MNSKYSKTLINQVVRKFKTREKAATVLGISARFVYMLQRKERKASPSLIKLMKMVLKVEQR